MLFFSYLCALFCVVCAYAYVARAKITIYRGKKTAHSIRNMLVVGTPHRSTTRIPRFHKQNRHIACSYGIAR